MKIFQFALALSMAATAFTALPAKAQDCSNYASYTIVNGQCVDLTDTSKRGVQGAQQEDRQRQQNPIVGQNFKVVADSSNEDAALVTGKLYNQSRRAVRVYTIDVKLTDYNMRNVDRKFPVGKVIPPGQSIPFEFQIPRSTVNLNNARARLVNSLFR
jgi:hypothetical protein